MLKVRVLLWRLELVCSACKALYYLVLAGQTSLRKNLVYYYAGGFAVAAYL
jgi:hypothetical protein